jgi:hypothetical protein
MCCDFAIFHPAVIISVKSLVLWVVMLCNSDILNFFVFYELRSQARTQRKEAASSTQVAAFCWLLAWPALGAEDVCF